MAFELHRTISQLKEAFRRDRGRAFEAEVRPMEAGEDKLVIGGGIEGRAMETMEEKDRQEEVKHLHARRYKLEWSI